MIDNKIFNKFAKVKGFLFLSIFLWVFVYIIMFKSESFNQINLYIQQNPKTKTIPLVVPLVVYHNKKSYPYSTNVKDIVDAPRELIEEYFLKPFLLVDLTKIADEELKQHA